MSTVTSDITLRISLPKAFIDKYESQAKHRGMTLEQEIESRLRLLVDVDSTKPLVINDTNRQKIERLLGRNFSDPDILVKVVERALQIQVASAEVPLTPHLLERLHSRCIGMPFDKFIIHTVTRLLQEYAGMR